MQFGTVHHVIYKERTQNVQAGRPTKPPGRTAPGHIHVWLGRLLIVLGIINGGLGFRLASRSPIQTNTSLTKAKIAYAVVAATMFLLYLMISVASSGTRMLRTRHEEVSRSEEIVLNKRGLPSYEESEELVGRSNGPR